MVLRSAATQVAEEMMQDEDGLKKLALMGKLTRSTKWKWLIDAFGQPFGGWNPGHLAFLSRLCELWVIGELAIGRLPVGSTPYRDRQRHENQQALEALRSIEGPELSAVVDRDQKTSSDGDGDLRWDAEIVLGIRDRSQKGEAGDAWAYLDPMPPGVAVPLEIGYTDPTTTYLHVYRGGVARWAYGSTDVVLIVPSTFVREAALASDESVRWVPEPLRHPFDLDSAPPAVS